MKTLAYLSLKLLNAALTMIWGFALTAIMVRAVGITEYARYVLVAAVGIYLSAADFGVSFLIYSRLREAFLKADVSPLREPVAAALSLYVLVTGAAVLLFVPLGGWLLPPGETDFVALVLFFCISALNLPWLMVRAMGNAVDKYMVFELLDVLRRVAHTGLISLMLMGVSPTTVFLLCCLVWLACYAFAFTSLRRSIGVSYRELFVVNRSGFRAFLIEFGSKVRPSLVFSLTEFGIYSFPYFYVPAIFGHGAAIVIFDLFSRFFRAAITANQVASGGLLPQITHAYHLGNRSSLVRALSISLLLSLAASICLAAVVIAAGGVIFPLLLDGQGTVSSTVAASIVIVTIANALQNTAGNFIVNVGLIHLAQRLAVILGAAMFVAAAASYWLGLTLDNFILTYAIVYLLGSLLWIGFGILIVLRRSGNFPSDRSEATELR